MSKAKLAISTAAFIALSGIVACSHTQKHSNVDASASAPAQPSVASGTTTAADAPATAPTDLGASTSGRGL